MRDLLRNTQTVFFRLYESEEAIIDQYGNLTGSSIPIYGELMSARLCVSPNKGATETEQFGSLMDYDRTMTTADTSVMIDENAVLWLDGADTNGPWNYQVKKRAPWKNSIQFAVKQVTVSAYNEYKSLVEARAKAMEVTPNAENQLEA